jgi:hypothetical protein
MPFANAEERSLHFKKHGHEFGATDEVEYEGMADAFMGGPMSITTRECVRPSGNHRVRVNIVHKHFGVAVVNRGIVLTYYIVPLHQVIRRGGIVAFFEYECGRVDF